MFVCAEIPDSNIDPILSSRLHGIVKRCMIHGPCGIAKKGAPEPILFVASC